MKTYIIYTTKHGCTEKAAHHLAGLLEDGVEVVNLKHNKHPNLEGADRIILGGSIHAGMLQSSMRKFWKEQMELLLTKPLGLYLCCMYEGDTATKQFSEAYPENLRNHAQAQGLFGGEFDFDKMNFFEKKIVEKVANTKESVSKFNKAAIQDFATAFK